MAGEYARIKRLIWLDDDFLDLSPIAQWLYFYLLTDDLSLAGVADWRPKRIIPKSKGLTLDVLESAATELQDALYLVIDEDTEEALIRSFIRHDGLLKQPKMGVAVAKAYGAVASRKLRGVLVHELKRLQVDDPMLKGWDSLTEILRKPSLNPTEIAAERVPETVSLTGWGT
ncbi:hypothetical protein [Arthrobacter sp. VKM Ac-2550]|uniref:hypothetical protein n=1 Tax=Crystallibacter permensis TaxID=1938888 RepID=UPI0022261319|nr:hypothetical protein [Arthrobacter sp. VKM Ac-2550]MCW2132921.1 hypothetical protein [Arthrobacter sp. VKM Ac-2550]